MRRSIDSNEYEVATVLQDILDTYPLEDEQAVALQSAISILKGEDDEE